MKLDEAKKKTTKIKLKKLNTIEKQGVYFIFLLFWLKF